MDKLEKLRKLLENEEEAKKIFVDSIEETQKNLQNVGIDLTLDELRAFAQGVADANGDGELTESALENVAGGRSKYERDCYNAGKKFGRFLRNIWDIAKEFATK